MLHSRNGREGGYLCCPPIHVEASELLVARQAGVLVGISWRGVIHGVRDVVRGALLVVGFVGLRGRRDREFGMDGNITSEVGTRWWRRRMETRTGNHWSEDGGGAEMNEHWAAADRLGGVC